MPTSATITNAAGGVLAFTIPQHSCGVIIQNQGAVAIYFRLGNKASTIAAASGDNAGILLPALANAIPGTVQFTYTKPLTHPLDVVALSAGADTALIYEFIADP